METLGIVTSHVWEPIADPVERLAERAGDVGVGVQDKRFARAMALMKLPRGRNGDPLPLTVLAHEKLASDLGRRLDLSVNEVYLYKLGPAWGDLEGSWASLHCLVPEPFQRLDETPEGGQPILTGADRTTLANDDEFRASRVFDAVIQNTDRHAGNLLVSGGRVPDRFWVYLIDHAYAFGGVVPEEQLAEETAGTRLRSYIEQRSPFRAWWEGLPDDARNEMLPLAREIADLRDEEIRALVRSLPKEVASKSTKRFLERLLGHHMNILRDSID